MAKPFDLAQWFNKGSETDKRRKTVLVAAAGGGVIGVFVLLQRRRSGTIGDALVAPNYDKPAGDDAGDDFGLGGGFGGVGGYSGTMDDNGDSGILDAGINDLTDVIASVNDELLYQQGAFDDFLAGAQGQIDALQAPGFVEPAPGPLGGVYAPDAGGYDGYSSIFSGGYGPVGYGPAEPPGMGFIPQGGAEAVQQTFGAKEPALVQGGGRVSVIPGVTLGPAKVNVNAPRGTGAGGAVAGDVRNIFGGRTGTVLGRSTKQPNNINFFAGIANRVKTVMRTAPAQRNKPSFTPPKPASVNQGWASRITGATRRIVGGNAGGQKYGGPTVKTVRTTPPVKRILPTAKQTGGRKVR